MAVILHLRVEHDKVSPRVGEKRLAEPVPLDALPTPPTQKDQSLLTNPFAAGRPLFDALGGKKLLNLLETDPDGVLILQVDEAAEDIPWEFAPLSHERDLLAARYGMVRLIDKTAPSPPANHGLHLIFLAADPVVDQHGNPREGHRLAFDDEMRRLRRVVSNSGRQVIARRIPPVRKRLREALRRGPVILHVSAHGKVISTDAGPEAVLSLEDEDGKEALLLGRDLVRMAPRGALRLAVLSACHTADGNEARLARAMVAAGAPAALGMQGPFPDPLSDDLVEALYDSIFAGLDLIEAVRQARQRLFDEHPGAAGQLVLYAARHGWRPLDIPPGQPDVSRLKPPGHVLLPQEVQPPRPLQGRLRELHDLAHLFSQGRRVVTITGAGGIGKTALAAAFAERFAWRWPQGVAGISFASGEVEAGAFLDDLIQRVMPRAEATSALSLPPNDQAAALLQHLRDWDGLLLLDNYETILQLLREEDGPEHAQARAIHRLVAQMADGGARLLLTSREQPAGLRDEITYPQRRALPGLSPDAAASLFLEHSARAKIDPKAHIPLAWQVAQVTEGHPLAVTLLAGEFDVSLDRTPEDFLAHWQEELQQAKRPGMAAHHITFAVAFDRSYRRLTPAEQERLRRLSIFPFPFFAEAAAFVWGLVGEDDQPDADAARPLLHEFVRRNLLSIEGTFRGSDQPATYRFLPVILEEVRERVMKEDEAAMQRGFAAYGAWLIDRGYGEISSDLGLARLVRLSMPALDAGLAIQKGADRIWRSWRLAWLKRSYGDFTGAQALLEPYHAPPKGGFPDDDTARAYSRVWTEMAYIYTVRGDLDEAMRLYEQALSILEQLGDQQGKASTLTMMAQLLAVRGDRTTAIAYLHEALTIFQTLGMPRETAQVQDILAQVQNAGEHTQSATSSEQQAILDKAQNLRELLQRARAADKANRPQEAIDLQEKAVNLMREVAQDRDALVQLSVMLYNLAGYYAKAGRFQDAVKAMEEVVALDERTGHPDLESDRQVLAHFRTLAAMPPQQRQALLAAESAPEQGEGEPVALEDLPEEVQAQLLTALRQLEELGPQGMLVAQTRDAAIAVLRGQAPADALLAQIEPLAAQIHANEPEGSAWGEAARFLDAVIALLRGQTPPPVPTRYAREFAEIQRAADSTSFRGP